MTRTEREKIRKQAAEALGMWGCPGIEEMRTYLCLAAGCIEREEPLPPKLRDFMVATLNAIAVDAQDANKALNLKVRGRPWGKGGDHKLLLNSEQRAMRDWDIFMTVTDLYEKGGASLDDICLLLSGDKSNTYPLTWDTIRKIYKREQKRIKDAVASWESHNKKGRF